jgi:hypothetical protein
LFQMTTMPNLIICFSQQDFPAIIPNPGYLAEDYTVVACGPTELLKKEKISLLNSRQSPHVSLRHNWIDATLNTLHHLDPEGTAIVTSLGSTQWNFATWAAARLGFSIILVFPSGSAQNFNISRTKAILELGLDATKTLALRPLRVGAKTQVSADVQRDHWVFALSHRIYPISLRPGGNFIKLLKRSDLPQETVISNFEIRYEEMISIKKRQPLREITLPKDFKDNDYFYHWTRSCVGPWPDEAHADYFERILSPQSINDGGLETLQRILDEKVIRASARLIRGKYEVVPFTERSPIELPELIHWRAGLRRWTVEPYGIAIKKTLLLEMGVRPVYYGTIRDYELMSQENRPFFQLAVSGKIDWRVEKEWRICGDLGFDNINDDELIVFVPDESTAKQLSNLYPFQVVSLENK